MIEDEMQKRVNGVYFVYFRVIKYFRWISYLNSTPKLSQVSNIESEYQGSIYYHKITTSYLNPVKIRTEVRKGAVYLHQRDVTGVGGKYDEERGKRRADNRE
jgi:hypothetical protein